MITVTNSFIKPNIFKIKWDVAIYFQIICQTEKQKVRKNYQSTQICALFHKVSENKIKKLSSDDQNKSEKENNWLTVGKTEV